MVHELVRYVKYFHNVFKTLETENTIIRIWRAEENTNTYLDVTGMEPQEVAENCITSSIETFVLHKIIVG